MIISDPHFAVNISPFTVYLIDRHGELNPEYVDRLNTDIELTGEVFRFKHILCSPGQLGNFMSSEYSSYLEECNVLVRLFPSQTKIFYFQIDTFEFLCSYEYFRYKMSIFIASITYQNNKNTGLYWHEMSIDHIEGADLYNRFVKFLRNHSHNLKTSNERFLLERAFPNDTFLISKFWQNNRAYSANLYSTELQNIEDLFELPNNEESDKLFYDVLNGTAGTSILTEYLLLQPEDETIDVSVEISYIGHSTGGEKPQYRFDYIIDNVRIPVYTAQIASAVIYLYILLFAKAGKKIYRENLRQNCGKLDLPPYLEILKNAYCIFLDTQNENKFKEWINRINNNDGRNLNQGKSNINSILMKRLENHSQREKNGLKPLLVKNYKQNDLTAYGISLNQDKIIVPEEFMPIVESITKFDFDGKFGYLYE